MKCESQPTQGQKEFLEKCRAFRIGMSKAEASVEIRKIIALKNKQRRLMISEPITDKQRFFLKNHGIDTKNMSKLQAMQSISKIKTTGTSKS
jgi:hypothetical protein